MMPINLMDSLGINSQDRKDSRYLRETKKISSDDSNIEKRAIDLYDLISEFRAKVNNFQIK